MPSKSDFNRVWNEKQRQFNIRSEKLEMAEALFIMGFGIALFGIVIGSILMLVAVSGVFN
jgi:hypothetical protein